MGLWKTLAAKKVKATTFSVGTAAAVTTQTHIADPSGGGTTDTQARAAIVSILDVLEAFGLTATS